MDDAKLRAAAEYVRDNRGSYDAGFDDHPVTDTVFIRHAKDLAADYLRRVPEDDGEPATMDWWKSLGAVQLDGGDYYLTKELGYDCHYCGVGTRNCIGWSVLGSFGDADAIPIFDVSSAGGVATRGDVRRLLAAMKIKPSPRQCPCLGTGRTTVIDGGKEYDAPCPFCEGK